MLNAPVLASAQHTQYNQQQQGHRSSVGMCPPPLEYEASEELQQELEAAAPDGFLCPIGR